MHYSTIVRYNDNTLLRTYIALPARKRCQPMRPKPKHLGPPYGAQFSDQSVVAAYRYRPPYPAEVFAILASLISDEPHAVLDAGCGTGDIARRLLDLVERVDAVDCSQPMIELGRSLPGGNDPRLHWIAGRMEDVPLAPPYALTTAGASLHWMDWAVVLPRFHAMLTPSGYLALVNQQELPTPWDGPLERLIPRFSTNQDFQPYDLVAELASRGLFQKCGERRTVPMPFVQPIDEYIESFHSRNGFSRKRMSAAMAACFDAELREVVAACCPEGKVALQIVGMVVWGKPQSL